MVKNMPTSAGDARNVGSSPGLGRSLGEDNGNSMQYSCLENSMDRGAWQATVHGVTKNQTQLKRFSIQHKAVTLKFKKIIKWGKKELKNTLKKDTVCLMWFSEKQLRKRYRSQ